MITSFLARLALALPLVLLGIVATLLLLKRLRLRDGGRTDLAAWLGKLRKQGPGAPRKKKLKICEVEAIGPTARLAVAEFAGQTYLVGISPAGLQLLATEERAREEPASEETGPRKTALRPAA